MLYIHLIKPYTYNVIYTYTRTYLHKYRIFSNNKMCLNIFFTINKA